MQNKSILIIKNVDYEFHRLLSVTRLIALFGSGIGISAFVLFAFPFIEMGATIKSDMTPEEALGSSFGIFLAAGGFIAVLSIPQLVRKLTAGRWFFHNLPKARDGEKTIKVRAWLWSHHGEKTPHLPDGVEDYGCLIIDEDGLRFSGNSVFIRSRWSKLSLPDDERKYIRNPASRIFGIAESRVIMTYKGEKYVFSSSSMECHTLFAAFRHNKKLAMDIAMRVDHWQKNNHE